MDRVSSAMISNSALTNIQSTQRDLFEAQRKTASENEAADMKGYGSETQTLVSTQRLLAKADNYIEIGRELSTRLAMQDVAIDRAGSAITNLREQLTESLSLNSGALIASQLEDAFAVVKDAFNTQLNGRYLFGGTLNDQPPILSASIDDLAANVLPLAFTQDAQVQIIRIEDHKTVEAGALGSTAANEIMDILKRLKEFDNGVNGPFADPLTDLQRTTLTTEIGNLTTAFDNLLDVQGQNGRVQNTVEASIARQGAQLDTMSFLIQDISSVDLAEVATELSQAQLQYEATAAVFNTIRGLSLLDYLR